MKSGEILQLNEMCAIIGVVGGALSKLVGGFDYALKSLLLLMLIDLIAGFTSAAFFNKSKYSKNGITSNALLKGGIRKISILAVVSVGVVVDGVMQFDYVRNTVVIYFIATEGISILEHLVNIGVPVPNLVLRILEDMREDSNNESSKGNSNKK